MTGRPILGWDVGGAHLKLARFNAAGHLESVRIAACPLWLGLDRLDAALDEVLGGPAPDALSAVTMTAELADCFPDRATGVVQVLALLSRRLGAETLRVFAGPDGFVAPEAASAHAGRIASANWYATAAAAHRLPAGILVDIGSTTADFVALADGEVRFVGFTDAERLATEELVYTGVVRTPVMAMAERLPVGGAWVAPMAELFATAADVHRLTGDLPADADRQPAADGGPKTVEASARRLLRIVGLDLSPETLPAAHRLAAHLSEIQTQRCAAALARLSSRGTVPDDAPIVGAGIGRFLARRVAERAGRPYRDIGAVLTDDPSLQSAAADCAPAVAIGLLLAERAGDLS